MSRIDITGRKVAILGAGREGRAAWRHLRSRYPAIELTLIDEQPADASLRGELTELDRLWTGRLADAGLEQFDILVRSPGISIYREALRRALAAGVEVTTPSNLWFADHPDERTICISGTKGKSTTSALLAHVLAAFGHTVRLAGNIGVPLLDCDDRGVDWWVIELSSFQLADLQAQPSFSVLLNLTPEHLDWHGSADAYRRDKLRLVTLAGNCPVIANAADPVLLELLGGRRNTRWFNNPEGIHATGGRLYDGDRQLSVRLPDGLPGSHNLSNIAAVLTALRETGLEPGKALDSLMDFRPLPHRLQLLGERSGLRFVNDSISSTPVATVAALEAYAGQPITLIVGGLDRGLDWAPHMRALAQASPLAVIAVPDNGPRIIATLRGAGIQPSRGLHEVSDLAAAVELAGRISPAGAIVLLSPGAPSFPRFRDYRDRGRQFAAYSGFDPDDFE